MLSLPLTSVFKLLHFQLFLLVLSIDFHAFTLVTEIDVCALVCSAFLRFYCDLDFTCASLPWGTRLPPSLRHFLNVLESFAVEGLVATLTLTITSFCLACRSVDCAFEACEECTAWTNTQRADFCRHLKMLQRKREYKKDRRLKVDIHRVM